MANLEPVYDPKHYEDKWYEFWIKHDLFTAKEQSGKTPYVVLMPPPNVTSKLHMGHGMGDTIQDILVRWKRMKGFDSCYLPGTDHAGIATQMMVEKALEKEGTSRVAIGREKFLERLWAWKEEHGGAILQQLRKLGYSCDWSRESFTMDDDLSQAVRVVFVQLFEAGLIYRGERLVNWDPALKTAVSDDEVYNEEVNGHLWTFWYPLADGSDKIAIATTRPETMLGDTAVAVHPDDERYKHMIGKQVRLPLSERLIPIIADDYVKSEFGTGAVKITPAHDPNDFEIGKRHKLPFLNVMNQDGSMNDLAPQAYRGLDRFVARKAVIKALKELSLFEKEESYRHSVPHSDRSKAVIEPRLSLQWFVKMAELAKPAADAARDGELRFFPDLWKKTYLHWLDNIQDWCISRQLWWGHRIPIWYCQDCQEFNTGIDDPTSCKKCQSKNLKQDEDVLDTWFSSWLWPMSPFGWPVETPDLNRYYPSAVLVTAPEIIFLWVARMVMIGQRTRGKIPFRDVYLTATVCDKQGRKFSKTLGNGIDPLEIIDKHGADAVRFTAVYLAPLGGRVRMAAEDFEFGAKFINKIWNASRFILSYLKEGESIKPLREADLSGAERWLLHEFRVTAEQINQRLEDYRINDAVDRLYHFIWGSFCDWGIEAAKLELANDEAHRRENTLSLLIYLLDGTLRLASPVMPFVTEEIWQKLPAHPGWDRPVSLCVAEFPDVSKLASFPTEHEGWGRIQDLISGIRSLRSQYMLPPKTKLQAIVKAEGAIAILFMQNELSIKALAGLENFSCGDDASRPEKSLVQVGKGYECYVPAADLVDFDRERERLKGEIARIEKIVDGIEKKLSNANFVDRAPADVVQQTRDQQANMQSQLDSLKKNLSAMV